MPNVNAIAGMIERVEGLDDIPPPPGGELEPTAGPPPPPPPGRKDIQVRFRAGKTVLLPGTASRYQRWVLRSVPLMHRPVYATLADDHIEELQVPIVGRVATVHETSPTQLRVRLDSSAQALTLSTAAERGRIHALLKTAASNRDVLMVVANSSSQIVDADLAPADAHHLAPTFGPDGAEPLSRVPVTKVSASQLSQVFEIATETACAIPPSGNCIPFNYPVDGCHARAHKVCRLLATEGFEAGKLWLFGFMGPRTTNHETCEVPWSAHVAPYVRRQGQSGRASVRVVDPTVNAERAMSLTTYLRAVKGEDALVLFSVSKFYQMGEAGDGSLERTAFTKSGSQSEDDLERFREEAANRRPQPPYVCPV
jgi:hypothetical protein